MIKINEAIDKASVMLKVEQIDMPNQKARLLMQYVLNKPRQYLIVYDKKTLTKKQEEKYFFYVNKIKKGTPLQHITHTQEFMKLEYYVNEDVLIPRPDTECLVEEVIKKANTYNLKNILDIGTGSGAIAISLAKYIEGSQIVASDINDKALQIAKKNAKINKVEKQIYFLKSDLFKRIPNSKFDIIVSNPPYIKREEIRKLHKDVQNEPKIALDGGWDGLDFYRKIAKDAPKYLKNKGYLCFEIGYDQREDVCNILEFEKRYSKPICTKDLFGNDRVIITKFNTNN